MMGPRACSQRELRREYTKASHMVNILSKAASRIDDTGPPDAIRKALEASEDQKRGD